MSISQAERSVKTLRIIGAVLKQSDRRLFPSDWDRAIWRYGIPAYEQPLNHQLVRNLRDQKIGVFKEASLIRKEILEKLRRLPSECTLKGFTHSESLKFRRKRSKGKWIYLFTDELSEDGDKYSPSNGFMLMLLVRCTVSRSAFSVSLAHR